MAPDRNVATTSNRSRDSQQSQGGKTVIVVKRRRICRRQRLAIDKKAKPGLPNLTKELTEPPPPSPSADDNDDDDALFGDPLEDVIPCDTLLAFQSLARSADSCLMIPLRASYQHVPCVLESQVYPLLKQEHSIAKRKNNAGDTSVDSEIFSMVTRELEELWHKNTLRRLTSVQHQNPNAQQGSSRLSAIVLTDDYRRGVWDAHDSADQHTTTNANRSATSITGRIPPDVQRLYVQWFVDHLHCWTGRLLTSSQLQETWNHDPPRNTLQYGTVVSLSKALDYLQTIQVIMANHQQSTYQLWLPEWGQVLTTLQSAEKKFVQKLHQTYQKELSEQTFLKQPFYNQIPTKLLLQWIRDQGKVRLVPKPYGNFIQLVENENEKKRKR